MQETFRDESGWCDLTDLHREVREKLEHFIIDYKNGIPYVGNEWRMPVLVAPYGSGKTALIRYLVRFCWRELRVPAILANLSDLVSFLENKKMRIHADMLADVVEEFFRSELDRLESMLNKGEELPKYLVPHNKNIDEYLLPKSEILNIIKRFKEGKEIGVLFIDEVEEAYKDFKEYVSYETVPFRGLADKIAQHEAKVFTVLAFGPSATLRECMSGPSWRMVRVEIPFVSKDHALRLLERHVNYSSSPDNLKPLVNDVLELLANSVWWMSKGRVAWIYKIINEGVTQRIVDALNNSNALRQAINDASTLSDEIIEGIPLMDKASFNKLLDDFRDFETLLLLSSVLVGPISESMLEALFHIDKSKLAFLNTKLFAVGRDVVHVKDVIKAFRKVLESELEGKYLEEALSILEKILAAWSRKGFVIYDRKALEELKNTASDYAFDIYADNPVIGDTLAKVVVDALDITPTRGEELHVALRLSFVAQIYPPLVLLPLIGLVKSEKISREELQKYLLNVKTNEMRKLAEMLIKIVGLEVKESKKYSVLFLPSTMDVKSAEDRVYECLRKWNHPLLVVVVGGTYEENEKLARLLRDRNKLIFETEVSTLPLIDRASLYVLSLLYNIGKGYNFSELTPIEEKIFKWYNEHLKFELGNAIYELESKYKNRSLYFDYLLQNSREKIESLSKSRGKVVGEQQARMLYLNAAFPHNIYVITEILEKLNEIKQAIREFLRIWSEENRAMVNRGKGGNEELFAKEPSELVEELFEDIKMLTERGAISFVKSIKDLCDSLHRDLTNEHLDCITKLVLSNLPNRLSMNDFYNLVWEGEYWIEQLMGRSSPEVAFTILSEILKRKCNLEIFIPGDIESQFIRLRISTSQRLIEIAKDLNQVNKELNRLFGLEFPDYHNVKKLNNSLNILIEKFNKLIEYKNVIKKVIDHSECPALSKLLLHVVLYEGLKDKSGKKKSDGILSIFASNIENICKYLDQLRSILDNIRGYLRKLDDLEDEDIPMIDKLKEAIINDLRFAIEEKGTLYDLCDSLESISKEIDVLKNIHEEYRSKAEEVRKLSKSILEKVRLLFAEEELR